MKKHFPSVLTGILAAALTNLTAFAFMASVSESSRMNVTAGIWLLASMAVGGILGRIVSAIYHRAGRN